MNEILAAASGILSLVFDPNTNREKINQESAIKIKNHLVEDRQCMWRY
jgi:hypothetical protein